VVTAIPSVLFVFVALGTERTLSRTLVCAV
jgi:hypothetical protein